MYCNVDDNVDDDGAVDDDEDEDDDDDDDDDDGLMPQALCKWPLGKIFATDLYAMSLYKISF